MSNTLLEESTYDFKATAFHEIKANLFLPALKEAINEAKGIIEEIKNEKNLSFDNIYLKLENSSEKVNNISQIFFALHGAEADITLRDEAKNISPLLTNFQNDVVLDGALFAQIKSCKEIIEKDSKLLKALNAEEIKLMTETFDDFIRNGALLSSEDKEKLRLLDERLSTLTLEFSDHILNDTNDRFLIIHDKNQLTGLEQSFLEKSQHKAKEKKLEDKFIITLDFPTYAYFMKTCTNRELRKDLYILYSSRGFNTPNDNQEHIKEIVKLRHEKALLLGHPNYACYVLEKRMATHPSKVNALLEDLLNQARPFALKEMEQLRAFKAEYEKTPLEKTELERWDFSFYSEKLKKKLYEYDDETLRPFFSLEKVIEGVFLVANRLYDLKFKPRTDLPVYHPDVQVFEVSDEKKKEFIGLLYMDFFPRSTKKNGAWMTSFREQKKKCHENIRPHISIVCNFTPPQNDRPSLLTLDEVLTLFHEFGHALHGLLSQCQFSRFAGTNVFWDFVELPSQIMENWVMEKECLDLFATHYQTGEKIPASLIEKVLKSSQFQEGHATLRQLSFGLVDMAWHTQPQLGMKSVQEFEETAIKPSALFPPMKEANISCAFSHIFSGGYAAGYYSYKWAEILDADAFESFKEQGIFNREISKKFRDEILSRGGSEHPMTLYRNFKGQEPTIKALLKRSGLL